MVSREGKSEIYFSKIICQSFIFQCFFLRRFSKYERKLSPSFTCFDLISGSNSVVRFPRFCNKYATRLPSGNYRCHTILWMGEDNIFVRFTWRWVKLWNNTEDILLLLLYLCVSPSALFSLYLIHISIVCKSRWGEEKKVNIDQ